MFSPSIRIISNHLALGLAKLDDYSIEDNLENLINRGDLLRLNIVVDGTPCDLIGTVIESTTATETDGPVCWPVNEYLKQNTGSLSKNPFVVKNITVTVKSRNYKLKSEQTLDYEVNFCVL